MNENLEKAIFDYENHYVGICDLSKIYKIPNKIIREELEKRGYILGKGVSAKSVVNIKRAVDEYITILSTGVEPNVYQLSQKYKISHTSITAHLKAQNIKIVKYPKKIQFDETVFDVIDTEEKAYWLGFFSADGYICSRDNTIGIALAAKDKLHVQKFATFLGCPENVKFKKNVYDGAYYCQVGNKHLKDTLCSYGFTSTKSYDLKFPDMSIFTNPDLIRHYLRGNFDGDGCISFSRHLRKRTNDYYCVKSINFIGTNAFIRGVQEFFSLCNSTIYRDRNHECFVLRTQKHAQKILDYLYKDSHIYLSRKYNLYLVAPHFVQTNEEKSLNIGED